MRLIDVDAVSSSDMLIAMADYTQEDIDKADILRGAVYGMQRLLNAQPTVDLWHYPSKGEYPTEGEPVCALVYGFDKPMIVRWYKYDNEKLYWQDCWDYCLYKADEVRCWQYIIPPKEEA